MAEAWDHHESEGSTVNLGATKSTQEFQKASSSADASVGKSATSGEVLRVVTSGASGVTRRAASIPTYIAQNPMLCKALCCIAGVVLSITSLVGMIMLGVDGIGVAGILQCIYMIVFGLVITIIDLGDDTSSRFCCNLQGRIFHYMNFLATESGRALFYFYVGSLTMLLLPDNTSWKVVYILVGVFLCIQGISLIVVRYCNCNKEASQTTPPAAAAAV